MFKSFSVAIREVFPYTVPIMVGYLLMGIAFGILLDKNGYNYIWAFFMGVFLYGGTTQFIAVELMACGAGLSEALILSLAINARQVFYAIAMLKNFENFKKRKLYMMHALTDETFALISLKKPIKSDNENFMFAIALLNHSYWVIGGVLGVLIGNSLSFDTKGIDFVMTAIFIIIFIDQWKNAPKHTPALVGIVFGLICLLVFGAQYFLLPALFCATLCLMFLKNRLE